MSDDIVARLRLWSDNAKEQDATDVVIGLSQAADEIERLRRDYSCICGQMRRMMNERDEARRIYCVMRDGEDGLTCKEWADRKGWDCFNENDND